MFLQSYSLNFLLWTLGWLTGQGTGDVVCCSMVSWSLLVSSSSSFTIWFVPLNSDRSSSSVGLPSSSSSEVSESQNTHQILATIKDFLNYLKLAWLAVGQFFWPVTFVSHCSSSAASFTGLISFSGGRSLSSSNRLCFLSSLSFKMTWGSDRNKLTRLQCWNKILQVNEWSYLLERSGFLGFGDLSLLSFLHQRAGGVQGIMCNFILLPGGLLLNWWLFLNNRKSPTNYEEIISKTLILGFNTLYKQKWISQHSLQNAFLE